MKSLAWWSGLWMNPLFTSISPYLPFLLDSMEQSKSFIRKTSGIACTCAIHCSLNFTSFRDRFSDACASLFLSSELNRTRINGRDNYSSNLKILSTTHICNCSWLVWSLTRSIIFRFKLLCQTFTTRQLVISLLSELFLQVSFMPF